MDTIKFLVVIGVLIAIPAVIRWIMNFLGVKVNQKLFQRDAHEAGQELVDTVLAFEAPTVSPQAVRLAVLEYPSLVANSALSPSLSIVGDKMDADGGRLTFAFASKVQEHFRGTVTMSRMPDGEGTHGTIVVIDALRDVGVIISLTELGNWRHDVVEAIKSADPQATFTELKSAKP